MKRIFGVWILSIIGLIGGCSSTALLYNNAPWLVREKIDDYFSITSIQEQQLDRDIGLFFKWHRSEELPKYASLISTFNREFDDGLTREELAVLFEQLAAARLRFAEASLPSASQFLATIDDEQLRRFDSEFQQQLAEDRKHTELSVKQQKQENFNKLLDTLKDWFGDFDEKQQQVLRRISDDRPNNYAGWLNRREQRQRKLINFLSSKPDASAIKDYLRRHYVQPLNSNGNEQQRQFRQYWLLTMLQVDKIITAEQRQRAIHRLDDYQQDFIQLSEQKEPEKRIEVER